MRVQGKGFKFFVDGESKTVEETKSLIHDNMTITIKGLDVFYFSPKKEINKIDDLIGAYDFKLPVLGCIEKQSKTKKEIKQNNCNYTKCGQKECDHCCKTEKLLKEAEEHQKQNGGVLQGVEFPFDSSSIDYKETYNQILDISNSLEKQFIDFNFRLPKENILGDGFFNNIKETEGQKHNEGKLQIDTMLTVQFPKAIQAVCKASLFGHEKYKETDKDWLNYKRVRGGSTTYANAGQRHNFNKAGKDEQSGLPHIVHKCWNALAELELWIEENKYE